MLTGFQWLCLVAILAITIVGGYLPLTRQERARQVRGFAMGQAFAAGVFLALCLTMMLPAGLHLLGRALPAVKFPLASLIGAAAFLLLLSLEHYTTRLAGGEAAGGSTNPVIPVIMTVMIALPSFLLGAALGVSESRAALMIAIAIMVHKGSAAFALALKMVRSTLGRPAVYILFGLFALSTPLGILAGEDVHRLLTGRVMWLVKGSILSLASGVFLYMSTLHDLKDTPLIVNCRTVRGFSWMAAGFVLTALVRLLIGEAHEL